MMTTRTIDVARKGWEYMLSVLEQPSDMPFLFYSVLRNEAHLGELLKLRRYSKWLESEGIKTVLDIGANSGQFSSAAASVLPDANIYSFEPIPEVHERLRKRMKKHASCLTFCLALGDKAGELTFWRNEFTKSSSLLPMTDLHKQAFPWTQKNTPIGVKVSTLDAVVETLDLTPNILMKIDVQGYELNVLKGAERTLRQVKWVWLETSFQPLYEHQAGFRDVYDFLAKRGLEYAGSPEQLRSPLNGSILQEDVLFVRPKSGTRG